MAAADIGPVHTTHDVLNQPPPLEGYNLFTQDRALVESVPRYRRASIRWRCGTRPCSTETMPW